MQVRLPRLAKGARPRSVESDASAPGETRALILLAGYVLPPLVALTIAAVVWEVWVRAAGVPTYLMPAPSLILDRLFSGIGFFARHGGITLAEALAGFALGSAVAIIGASVMAYSRLLERSLFPLAVLVKVTPIVAVAPLFVIWFGFGSFPKILIAALITFFPVLVNGLTGLRAVRPEALEFFQSVASSKRETYVKLRLPSSLPYLFAAFRISVPLSVIGAVVGEWFSGDRGLGSVIIVSHNNLDMPTLFAAIVTLAVIGIGLTMLTWWLEKRVLFWHESNIIS
ncbi:MAG: ABC transporter permease [SAR202 cluster bacterium]|nr:ABC transporter permease [SAR202 cluster bacterium]